MVKKGFKALGILVLVIVVVVAAYVAYLFISYKRLPDNLPIDVETGKEAVSAVAGQAYDIVTWNLGFGAYSADYSFFMDGGTESRARSEAAVLENIGGSVNVLKNLNADFMLLQELDLQATRSYKVDEVALVQSSFEDYTAMFAQNYDSAYLFYPILEPHGASKAGILTLSSARVDSAVRHSLPVETGVMKFFDLDRCYSVSRIPVDNGKTLCLYNLHLSAYTSDGRIATEQLEILLQDMADEYAAGNYVVGGGDFNKDLLGNASEVFGVSGANYTWAQPIPAEIYPEGLSLVSSLDAANPVPSCRNADKAYQPGESFVLTVDGFIVSDNVQVSDCRVLDEGFAYSDHNPVVMTFTLQG